MSGDRADEDAIRGLIARQIRGWAAGDPDAYAGVFTPDADCVTVLGSHSQNTTRRRFTETLMARLFS